MNDRAGRRPSPARGAAALDWLARHPLAVCLPIQAALLFAHLSFLPTWGDEQATLARSAMPFDELFAALRGNVHPPLYLLLVGAWLQLPWWGSPIAQARALSAACVLLALLAVDRCWLRDLDRASRWWFLALWTLSPALLLYGRMARSYSLQLLLATLALHWGWQCARAPSRWRAQLAYVAALTLLLYTHYLPGVAIGIGVALVAAAQLWRTRDTAWLRPLVLPPLLCGLAYLPWLSAFAGAVERVGHATVYQLMPNRVLETIATLGFTFTSLTFGETHSLWSLGAALLLAPAVLALLGTALRWPPAWLALVGPAAVIAYVAAVQWVSYGFVGARLLFLAPFYWLLLVQGRRRLGALGTLALAGICCVGLMSIAHYWRQEGFLNQAYVIPFEAIAERIRTGSAGAPTTVIIDHHSTNLTAIAPLLPDGAEVLLLDGDAAARAAETRAGAAADAVMWFARGTHDVSAEHLDARVEAALAARYSVRRHPFAPYSAIDRIGMRLAGWAERPTHAVELLELHRLPVGRPPAR